MTDPQTTPDRVREITGTPAHVLRELVYDGIQNGRITVNTARVVMMVVDMLDGPIPNERITS